MNEPKQSRDIAAGEIFAISCGEYSDYSISFFGRALSGFNVDELIDRFVATKKEYETYFSDYQFVAWFSELGFAEEIKYREWHLADYSEPDRTPF